MTTFLADDGAGIRKRMAEIAQDEGQPSDALLGFDGDLDGLAKRYELARGMGESDDQLMQRVIVASRESGDEVKDFSIIAADFTTTRGRPCWRNSRTADPSASRKTAIDRGDGHDRGHAPAFGAEGCRRCVIPGARPPMPWSVRLNAMASAPATAIGDRRCSISSALWLAIGRRRPCCCAAI